MKYSPEQLEAAADRIKLPFNFDKNQMLKEVQALNFNSFLYYEAIPLRSPAHLVDPSIPFPPPADDYADGSWCDWLDTKSLKSSEYLNSIADFFKEHCTVNLIRLLRLEPGQVVTEHNDPTLGIHIEKSMIRLTIPILINDKVEFWLNNSIVPMEPGECWYLRLTDPHKVINAGNTERINLTIDVVPNEWITDLIMN